MPNEEYSEYMYVIHDRINAICFVSKQVNERFTWNVMRKSRYCVYNKICIAWKRNF